MAGPNLSGSPKTVISITDLSIIVANILKGYIVFQAPTKRGEPGKLYGPFGSWSEARRELGGLKDDDDQMEIVKRALEGGAIAFIIPAFHYTDIDDLSTADGDKSTATLPTNNETLAVVNGEITDAGDTDDTVTIRVDEGSGMAAIGTHAKLAGQTATEVAISLVADINSKTKNNGGYTAVHISGANFRVIAPVGSGATANAYNAEKVVTGTLTSTIDADFAGGVDATNTADFESIAVGQYAGTTIEAKDASDGDANNCDIIITLNDSDISQTIRNFDRSPDAAAIAAFNAKANQIVLTGVTGTIQNGTATMTGGTKDSTAITDADYKGSDAAKNGWHTMDEEDRAMRVFATRSSPTYDADLDNYCAARKDMRAALTYELDIDRADLVDRRNGTGSYSHSKIDSYWSRYILAGVEIPKSDDPDAVKNILAMGDAAALRSITDRNFGEWFSDAGNTRGVLKGNVNGPLINLGGSGNATKFDEVYEIGLNAIIKTKGITKLWGNRNNLVNTGKIMSKDNVADMVIFTSRVVKDVAEAIHFEPNDPISWNLLYRSIRPFIVNTLVAGRAIVADQKDQRKGEDKTWFWFGDQFAADSTQATFNTQADINSGKYRARFVFVPITANEYIGIDLAPTDSITLASIVENPQL